MGEGPWPPASVLARIDLVRVNDPVLATAGVLLPIDLGSLAAIHLATARRVGTDLGEMVTYDLQTALAAQQVAHRVSSPS